jgi:hypothetical protein
MLEIIWVKSQPVGFALAKDRYGTQPKHGKYRGPEGCGRYEDLIARLKSYAEKCGEEGRSSIAVGKSIGHGCQGSVIAFQFPNDRMGRNVSVLEDLDDRVVILMSKDWPTQCFCMIFGDCRRSTENSRLREVSSCHECVTLQSMLMASLSYS